MEGHSRDLKMRGSTARNECDWRISRASGTALKFVREDNGNMQDLESFFATYRMVLFILSTNLIPSIDFERCKRNPRTDVVRTKAICIWIQSIRPYSRISVPNKFTPQHYSTLNLRQERWGRGRNTSGSRTASL